MLLALSMRILNENLALTNDRLNILEARQESLRKAQNNNLQVIGQAMEYLSDWKIRARVYEDYYRISVSQPAE